MKFTETGIADAWLIGLEPHRDERGLFARTFCADEFAARGIRMPVHQANLAATAHRATLRGLHYQVAPAAEAKLIRCVRGSVFDVLVDLRAGSATYLQWFGATLSASNGFSLYVPPMCAHGYLSLEDDCEVFYLVSEAYTPGAERGARFDDPAFGIRWPIAPARVSDKDLAWEAFREGS